MVAIALANLADICTFFLAMELLPLAAETNPVVAPLWAVSPWMIVLFKVAAVAIVLLILGRVHPRIRRWGTFAAVAVPLIGTAANTLSGLIA